jgi:hypothetical protein
MEGGGLYSTGSSFTGVVSKSVEDVGMLLLVDNITL